MSSIEGSPTGRLILNDVKVHVVDSDGIESEVAAMRAAFDAKVGEMIEEQIMLTLTDVDFSEIEQRVMAQEGKFGMEEMKRMMLPIGLGDMLAEQMAEQRERMRWGNTPKTKPPERFTWKDKDPGRAKAKAARKQNKKRRQK